MEILKRFWGKDPSPPWLSSFSVIPPLPCATIFDVYYLYYYTEQMCRHEDTRACTHLLRHEQFNHPLRPIFNLQTLIWANAFQGLGLATPRAVALNQGNWTFRKGKRKTLTLRVLGHWPFAEQAISKTFGVAHQNWPTSPDGESILRDSFGLREPPSPYEMACFMAEADTTYQVGGEHACGRSLLSWWCSGIGAEVLDGIVPDWEKRAARYIRALLDRPLFIFWALGTDLRPIIRNRAQARSIISPTKEGRFLRKELSRHPYIQGQLRSGRRLRPVLRTLPKHPPVWQTIEEREEWEKRYEDDWRMTKLRTVRKRFWENPMSPCSGPMPHNWEPQQRATL